MSCQRLAGKLSGLAQSGKALRFGADQWVLHDLLQGQIRRGRRGNNRLTQLLPGGRTNSTKAIKQRKSNDKRSRK
jgi:hypothetical protein